MQCKGSSKDINFVEQMTFNTVLFALFKVLLDWINDELSELRIVLRDITEDLYDGQILAILMGMLIIFFSVTQMIML